jgi:hypothetical protein
MSQSSSTAQSGGVNFSTESSTWSWVVVGLAVVGLAVVGWLVIRK